MEPENQTEGEVARKIYHVVAAIAIVLTGVGGLVTGIVWVANLRNDAKEARRETARLQEELRDVRQSVGQQSGGQMGQTGGELTDYETEMELQKQDLTERVSSRVNPILRRLGQRQAITSMQIDQARQQILREVRKVVREEQRQNESLRNVLTKEQESRVQIQGVLETEQGKNHDLQERLLETYGVAERSLRLANELRILYVQMAKKDGSVLGNTLETVKLPFKIAGNLLDGQVLSATEAQRQEQNLRRRFDDLSRDLQSCNPRMNR